TGIEWASNARIAANLGSPVVIVVHGSERTPAVIAATIDLARSELTAAHAQPVAAMKIVDLPTVTVQATAEELAIYHANRIVDLATVTVRPSADDWATLAREESNRIVDLPAVTVRPSAEDLQQVAVGAVTLVQQLATR
ncbi:MAG: AAA family ATPase, partial [Pseudoxanthomonas sp.]